MQGKCDACGTENVELQQKTSKDKSKTFALIATPISEFTFLPFFN